jgi:hypothetical protein
MLTKDTLLKDWEREFQITLRFLKAYPPAKINLKIDEGTPSARDLAWGFIRDEWTIQSVINRQVSLHDHSLLPETLEEIILVYRNAHQETMNEFEALSENNLNRSLLFIASEKETFDVQSRHPFLEILVNHAQRRGGFSIYLQMCRSHPETG